MKIVIDIPDEDYKDIVDGYICQELADEMLNRVKVGTPLPKGHGDLIDLNTIHLGIEKFHCKGDWETANWEVEKAKVVIHADKGE